MIRLVLTDIDNTLVPYGERTVVPESHAAIKRLMDLGVVVGPATGRGHRQVREFMGEDASQTMVASNGQEIFVGGKPVFEAPIAHEDAQTMLEIIEAEPTAALFVDRDDSYVLGTAPEDVCNHLPAGARRAQWRAELPEGDFLKLGISVAGEVADAQRLHAALCEAVPAVNFMPIAPFWFDLAPQGISKAHGIEVLAQHLGLELDEILVFGDSLNDVEMLKLVPNSVVVANASPEAAAVARYRIGESRDHSVAAAFNEVARAIEAGDTPAFMR
jgi:Cof subfamily protein (haloacid dehalogenase superfamily)